VWVELSGSLSVVIVVVRTVVWSGATALLSPRCLRRVEQTP
jgi:hypothetical protein